MVAVCHVVVDIVVDEGRSKGSWHNRELLCQLRHGYLGSLALDWPQEMGRMEEAGNVANGAQLDRHEVGV